MSFSVVIGIAVALIVFLAFINLNALKRLLGVASAKANTLANAAEDKSRVDLAYAAIEKDKEALRKANERRIAQQKNVNTVKRVHEKLTGEMDDLQKRIVASTEQSRKIQLAKELVRVKADLENATQDLETQTRVYEQFKADCDDFEQKIKNSERTVDRSVQQSELAKAAADMAEMTAPMLAESGSEVDKHLDELQKHTDTHNARAQVARERNAGAYALKEENRRMQDQEALDLLAQIETESKAKKGMDDLFPNVKEQA